MNHFVPPKTCVIGASGFIGQALFKTYSNYYPNLIGTHYLDDKKFKKLDLSLNEDISHLPLNDYSYAVIAAGVANIRFCEENPEITHQINVSATFSLAEQLINANVTPILFSTDYVFDGISGSYTEGSVANPLNEYGKQKAILESLLEKHFKNKFLMIRLSKIFGLEKGDKSLIDEMIDSCLTGKAIRAAYDQVFNPISIDDVVSAIINLQKIGARGLYNVCGNDVLSRYELAQAVVHSIGRGKELLEPISLIDLNEPFSRPNKTNMSNEKLKNATGIFIQSLQASTQSLIKHYLGDIHRI